MKFTEESGVHKEWYKKAREVKNTDDLVAFIKSLMDGNQHDYGTICHAVASSALAAAVCVNRDEEQGGITDFQANAVMWEFIRAWLREDGPMRLVQYEKMLYPRYGGEFEKTMRRSTWEFLQNKAKEMLSEHHEGVHPEVLTAHWQSIIDGKIPFGYTISDD